MTPQGLRQLVIHTALAHALPGITLCFRAGSSPLLFAGGNNYGQGAPWVSACSLRRNLCEALHRTEVANDALTFLELPEGVDPSIDVGTTGCSQVHPGGIVSAVIDDQVVQMFATTLNAAQVRIAVSHRIASGSDSPACRSHQIRLYSDSGLRVTLVSIELPLWSERTERVSAVTALQGVLSRCCTTELDDDLRQFQTSR